MAAYEQVLDPLLGSLGLSALAAALPLLVLFVLLGIVRMAAWKASLVALVVALAVAVLVYPMPVVPALLSASLGAAFGFFPILRIVINAIWGPQHDRHDRAFRRPAAVVHAGQR
ncbi:L-lactate permease [Saccharopolyspora karakumensis]|uniref:L-lactate permease n=1 Tax=Saccharopolyspora karakumensis TaxID=2530386 RepID=UPI002E261549